MFSILFVSHDAALRAAAGRSLERAGHTVTTAAHSGHAILAVAGGRRFDVLIVENELRESRGKTVADRLRRTLPGLAVVVMCDRRSIVPADEIAVVRPFTADDLLHAVLHALAADGLYVRYEGRSVGPNSPGPGRGGASASPR